MRASLLLLLCLTAFAGYAQNGTAIKVPATALEQLEELKELTKTEAVTGKTKGRLHAETRPDINRWLVVSANDFVQVTRVNPTQEAYLLCIETGLARLAPLAQRVEERQQVAEFFQELMEIVGLKSSGGRLTAFTKLPETKK